MSKPRAGRGVAVAVAVITAAIVTAAGSPSAFASHAGNGAILTATGSNAIDVAGGSSIQTGEQVSYAAWSPNGECGRVRRSRWLNPR